MNKLEKNNHLFVEIKKLVEEARGHVARAINTGLTATYWNIGKRLNEEILKDKRAEYGKQILPTLSAKLVKEFGNGFSARNLKRMIDFYTTFPDCQIASALWSQLNWSHFILIIPIKNKLERDFYTQMCRVEKWSVRTLRKKIDSMLFDRTAISKKPEQLAKEELKKLETTDTLTPDLVFKDHYILDFLGLKDTWSEKDFEATIIREIEAFLLELGAGFTFVARQKRMVIDNEDFYLDLLFYHRKLKRLIALDLKIGKFKAHYKGQMELYLRWLEKNETEEGEEQPIGLILCAEGNHEQIELLQLDKENIKVAEYITKELPKELLAKKLHQFAEKARLLIESREGGGE